MNKQSDERMRFLQFSVERTMEAAFWIGPDAKFIYVNDATCKALGYSKKELLNMTVHDIDPDFPKKKWKAHWNEVKERGSFIFESRHRTKYGKIIPVEISVNFMEFEGKEYNFAFARDITERRAAEDILIEGEARLQQIINQMPYPIEVCSPDGTATLVNKAYLEMRSFSSGDAVIGKYNVFEDPFIKNIGIIDKIKKVYKGKSVFLPEVRVELKKTSKRSGSKKYSIKYFELTMFPVKRPKGDLWRVVTIWKDNTEQKASERKIKVERNRAELYLDILGHDINNLNQAIITSNEILLMNPEVSNEVKKYTMTSLRQARAMADLIEDVYKLSIMGAREFEHKKIDVRRIIQDSVTQINEMYPNHKIDVNHQLKDSEVLVKGNELLKDVFNNIITNAIKSNKNERVEIDISHNPVDEENMWKLEIKDNSTGIPDGMKNAVFNGIEQGEKTIRGLGLGLTIVNEVVNRCGGRVWVENRVEGDFRKGSNFVIMLPMEVR